MQIFLQCLFAFLGTVSFAILFDAAKKHYFLAGLIGMVGWIVYLTVNHYSTSKDLATFLASLVLSCLATVGSYWRKTPKTIFLICGIFTLVPGIGIYNVAYEFFLGGDNPLKAAESVFKTTFAIAFGIVIANTITTLVLKFYNPKNL